ncbi:DUF2975 domain-containing protein [Mucilaginibacter flavus]|uniref:DUF2975 domain-containing protein n=1 Tax=Mucilaginibacter flavus TaxID=931504 RepID=UPI0025B3CA1B|nr:DUF2975 domain-containing protein [Mucilaginibacter flavus]MDN3579718.1 DUF2975 domain-containing protein [Mucilaginibacter flavus]
MKKIRSLQIMVYIVFGALLLKGLIAGGLEGFKEGYGDVKNVSDGSFRQSEVMPAVFDGSVLTHNDEGKIKISDKYLLENVNITADLRVNTDKIAIPYVLTGLKWIFSLALFIIVIKVAVNTNRVIKQIADGTMFNRACIKVISNTGMLLLLFSLVDFAQQQLAYYQQSILTQGGLKVVNVSTFDFGSLIMAILVFIIAEAFKQGAKLKEEQALII